ncbi:BTB/POZ domain-containing protein 6-like [Mytilus trossulus]|uniref:BTB/POZ domain-containing protein 6-like n=1 Tax=Mytilus trossulus TaxID=6551 RepID=UPI00300768B6
MDAVWQEGKSLSDRMKYMLDNQLMCDVTFHVGSDRSPIKAHKYMLASASPVFYSMYGGPLSEKGDVEIVDMTQEHFKMMLMYIYTDNTIMIDAKSITGLMYSSEKYMLVNLKEQCSEFLNTNIDIDHACDVFQTANDFHMEDLKTNALNFIFKNPRECLDSDDFNHLSAECVKLIVESDKLNCEEEIVFKTMIKWAKLRCEKQSIPTTNENIRKALGNLLYLIRFPCMTPKVFTDNVSSMNILTFEEKERVYDHFNGKHTDIFSSKTRFRVIIVRCEVDTSSFTWSYSGIDDCIDFETSNDAELISVLLFGSKRDSALNRFTLNILHGSTVLNTIKSKLDSSSSNDQGICEILLESPVKIVSKTTYTVQLCMSGPSTVTGKNYIIKNTSSHGYFSVTFLQSSLYSQNGTCENRGQIPGLIFVL